jgi:hypothetical protein
VSDNDQGSDQRAAPRMRVLGHAKIVANGGQINCVVRDLSDTGAKLGVSRKVRLPQTFILCFVKRNLMLPVRLRWRDGDHIGVSFEMPAPRPAPKAPQRRYLLDV